MRSKECYGSGIEFPIGLGVAERCRRELRAAFVEGQLAWWAGIVPVIYPPSDALRGFYGWIPLSQSSEDGSALGSLFRGRPKITQYGKVQPARSV